DAEGDFEDWAVQVLRDRVGKFVKSRYGENVSVLDETISWTAFMGGTDPRHRDFVVRRVYRALRSEDIVYEGRMSSSTGRPAVCLIPDQRTQAELLEFVQSGTRGPTIQRVVNRLVRGGAR